MTLIDHILSIPVPLLEHWGYAIMGVMALLESTPILGGLVPGQTVVIFGGFLSKMGTLNPMILWIIASMGAIIGDLIGYSIGKRYGYDFIVRYGQKVYFKPVYFERTRNMMSAHAGKTLLVGRFIPFTRALAPFIAGASRVTLGRFLVYDIIGGIAWAFVSVGIGFLFGASYEIGARYFGRFIIVALILAIIIGYGYRFMQKRKHLFERSHMYLLAAAILSLYAFAKITDDVVKNQAIVRFDTMLHYRLME